MFTVFIPTMQQVDVTNRNPSQILGTGFYSLSECECFGEAYANTPPVVEDANEDVPRNGHKFNQGPLSKDLQIFAGPYHSSTTQLRQNCENLSFVCFESTALTINGFCEDFC